LKLFFHINLILLLFAVAPTHAQTKKPVVVDSVKLAEKAKRDSVAQANKILSEKRKEEARIRKEAALARKRKKVIPITEEMGLGYRMNSDGWSFFVHRGLIKTEDPQNLHTLFLFGEFGEKRHPKEIKSFNETFTTVYPNEPKPVSYKYGKINNFYPLRLGIGNTKPLTGKLDQKSVRINWTYSGGISIGLLKPYYLDFLVPEGNVYIRTVDKYSEEVKTYFLDLENRGTIVGGSDFTKGISEIKIIPGICAKTGFYFDYTSSEKTFLGVEIGCGLELYSKKVEIMALMEGKPYFFNVYADFRIGRRWKKKPLDYEEVIEEDDY
jgi:hypothetical protein